MRTNLLRLLALCAMIILSGCEKEATLPEEDNTKEIKTTFNDIAGVYEALSNDLFFISISDDGCVSYCLSEYVMGHGNAVLLDEDIFSVQNTYTEYTDNFTFVISGNTLNLVGHIAEKTSGNITEIKLTMQKVDEDQESNFIGKSWYSTSGLSSSTTRYTHQLYFSEKNTATYLVTISNIGAITSLSYWYYIPRSHHEKGDIIYTNKGDETSTIYCYKESFYNYF